MDLSFEILVYTLRMAIRIVLLLFHAMVWSLKGYSFEIQRQGDDVFLKSSDCSEVSALSNAIYNWKQKTDSYNCTLNPAQKNGQCIVEISNCLPEKVKNYFAKRPTEGGPNCYNAGLVFMGLLSNLRYSTEDEISFYMNSGLCKKLGPNEKPIVGDLGLISMAGKKQPYFVQHAFIYLSEYFVYEKPNQHRDSPFIIANKRNTLSEYGLTENEAPDASTPYKGIDREVTYYRCVSTKEYLGESPNVPQTLAKLWSEMDSVEKCFEIFTMTQTPLSPMARNNILNVAKALTEYLRMEKGKDDGHDQEKTQFMIASLQLKLKSISENLPPSRFVKKTDDKLVRFSEDLRKSLAEK